MSKRMIAIVCLLMLLVGCSAPSGAPSESASQPQEVKEPRFTESIKILAIGNSYTQNAVTYLYDILADLGVEQIVVANLYIGGCDLGTHAENAQKDAAAYEYYKTEDGVLKKKAVAYSLKQGITDENWDIIVLNQASQKAGQDMTYLKLDDLCAYVNEHKTNPEAELWWHMTWAYHPSNPHAGFSYYNKNQNTMYEKIVEAVQLAVEPLSEISGVIPSGTAYQNARAVIGNGLTADDLHHANEAGCYLLGLTWAAALTNRDVTAVTYAPEGVLVGSQCRRAAAAAVAEPFAVTE